MDNKTTYSQLDLDVLRPVNTITAGSLKDAAGTSLGIFTVPQKYGTVEIIAFGFHFAAAGGAETTSGTAKLQIAGSDVNNASASPAVASSSANHAAWDSVETDLNATSASSADATNKFNTAPNYPDAEEGQKIELLVATQGVGAGDQTVHPYLVIRRKQA